VGGERDRCLDGERRRGIGDRARRHEGRGRGPRGGDAAKEGGCGHGDDPLGFRGGCGAVGVGTEEGRKKIDARFLFAQLLRSLRRWVGVWPAAAGLGRLAAQTAIAPRAVVRECERKTSLPGSE